MKTSDFFYDLPTELIAQSPANPRDASRCLVLNRSNRSVSHLSSFRDIPSLFRPGDVLVVNNTQVVPARTYAEKESGGQCEVFFLKEIGLNLWEALIKPAKKVRLNDSLRLKDRKGKATDYRVKAVEKGPFGLTKIEIPASPPFFDILEQVGHTPLPPYIQSPLGQNNPNEHRTRYQTVFAQNRGSVAAPTAGLHFTPELLQEIQLKGIEKVEITLHVGYGTFSPVKTEQISDHQMHSERYHVSEWAADSIQRAKSEGRRVIAVGTTSLRVLESVGLTDGRIRSGLGETNLFIHPPSDFLNTDALITNFHLPESTLLMLVSAFADPGGTDGRDWVLQAYREAIRHGYRFFSFGDAMFLF